MIAIGGVSRKKYARRKPGINHSNERVVDVRYFAAASLSGSFTDGKVSNSIAHGSPFTFCTLRM
jgi:hypothetical protein